MRVDPGTLRARLDRLNTLVELARRAPPKDRIRLERTIQAITLGYQAVARAWRAERQAKEFEARALRRKDERATLLAELCIKRDNTSK